MASPKPKKRRSVAKPVHHAYCTNCGQEVAGKVAVKAASPDITFCPIHGCQRRPDGSCPDED